MFGAIAKALFGSQNDRILKGLQKPVAAVNALEPEIAALSDDDLKAKTSAFKARLAAGEDMEALLPEPPPFDAPRPSNSTTIRSGRTSTTASPSG